MRGGSRAARRDARRPITAASCPPSVPTERVGRRGRDSDLGQVARAAQEAPPPTGPPRAPDRAGPREALAACREGDTLVVTKLDRLARSLPDARAIAEELTERQVRLICRAPCQEGRARRRQGWVVWRGLACAGSGARGRRGEPGRAA